MTGAKVSTKLITFQCCPESSIHVKFIRWFSQQAYWVVLLRPPAGETKAHRDQNSLQGTSLVVQWLRLCALDAGDPSSISGQGTINRFHTLQLEIRHTVTKTLCGQINLKNKTKQTSLRTMQQVSDIQKEQDMNPVGQACAHKGTRLPFG